MSSSTLVHLGIREFAFPSPKTGSIEAHSGYGRSQAEGQRIHLEVQKERAETWPRYEAESPIAHEFERGGYTFKISGRMDGFVGPDGDEDPPAIEEIKGTFNVHELVRRLQDAQGEHPYSLQLRTYGYFYWLKNAVTPRLTFHLVSTRNGESLDLEIPLQLENYQKWLDRRLDELVLEAQRAEARARRRAKIASDFAFPFPNPRPGQLELVGAVEQAMKDRHRLLVQAPTGLGKTAGILYPALKEALARGQSVIYVTPKNSQHAVAEDAVERFQENGSKVRSLTITAKAKSCMKAEPLCNPDYCEYAKDYYTKVAEKGLLEELSKKKKLSSRTFKKMAEDHQVCPFELQLDAAAEADVVICDYNYVFSPRSALGRINSVSIGQEGQPNLVVDEAHNLVGRAMDYFSPALSSFVLEKMREQVRELPRKRFKEEAEELLDECLEAIARCKPKADAAVSTGAKSSGAARITPPTELFLEQDGKLRGFLSRYLESDVEIQPKDVVLKLCFYWAEFTAALEYVAGGERAEFFTTYQPNPSGGTVRITCCDASEMLKACYDGYENVVAFSATLKPFDYHVKLSGLHASDPERVKTAEFASPFDRARRKLLLIPQISTKYSERARNYPRIAETIARISAVRPGNYFAFFPSFEFLERVLEQFSAPPGFAVIQQMREMKAAEIESVIEHLRAREVPTIVFGVQGGVFSEGVDYPGDTIIGAFIVGPPLPSFDLEREEMRGYYERSYQQGFEYAYAYPAMAKAVQAAGRVIRSETDRGIIVLMDNRFLQKSYTQSMPADWFDRSPQELVSTSILSEVAEFWERTEPT